MTNKSQTLWFASKKYGWGWVPVTWQGWVVIAIYVGFVLQSLSEINQSTQSLSSTLINTFGAVFVYTAVLFLVCLAKGEKPTWKWGKKK